MNIFSNFRSIFDASLRNKFHVTFADSSCKLEDLNHDCLWHIISYLNVMDTVQLGRTSTLMKDVTQQTYKKFSHFSLGRNYGGSSINESTLPVILENIGSYIRSIEIYNLNESMLASLSEYCSNVTVIKLIQIKCRDLHGTLIKENKQFFANVTSLEMNSCGLYDTSLNMMCNSKKLVSLQMNHCNKVSGSFISKLKNLEVLRLTKCNGLGVQYIRQWKKLTKLVKLSLSASYHDDELFFAISEIWQNFQELSLHLNYDMDAIDSQKVNFSQLNQLRKLTLNSRRWNLTIDVILRQLAQIETLEYLKMVNVEVSEFTLTNLALLQNLKCLHLYNIVNTSSMLLYTNLPRDLPLLKELTINMTERNVNHFKSISKMVSAFERLECFSHSAMGISLLQMIIIDLELANRGVEIQVAKSTFEDPVFKVIITDYVRKNYK